MVSSTGSLSGQDDFRQVYQQQLSGGTAPAPAADTSEVGKRKKRRARRDERRSAAAPAPYSPGSGGVPGNMPGGATAPPVSGTSAPGVAMSGGQGVYHNQGGAPTIGTMPGPFGQKNQAFNVTAAHDPFTFFGAELGPGQEGGFANQFFANSYDPYNLSVAMGRSPLDQDVLNFGHSLAQSLMGEAGMGKFMDPMSIIASVFKIAGSVNANTPGAGPLSVIATQDPGRALQTFLGVLQGAVQGILPEESWSALQSTIQQYAAEYMQQWGSRPMEETNNGQNIIGYIASKLGPNFGIY